MTDGLTKNWEKVVEDAAAIGQQYVVLAYLMDGERKAEDYNQLFDLLNKSSDIALKSGLTMGYHNHDFEFTQKSTAKNLMIYCSKTPMSSWKWTYIGS